MTVTTGEERYEPKGGNETQWVHQKVIYPEYPFTAGGTFPTFSAILR